MTKRVRKMGEGGGDFRLVVNFINVLLAAFARTGLESAKRQSSCQSFLRFWDLRVQKLLIERR